MNLPEVITSQYLASLKMLKQTIEEYPAALWDSPDDKVKFWHVAYHALFYTHLYLQDTEQDFTPWSEHHPESQFIGRLPMPPHDTPTLGEPYTKPELLAYLAICQQEVRQRVPRLDLEAASGFDWLPFGKLELQFYNIRHLQQHTGELMERVGSRARVEIDWVGAQP